MPDFLLRCNVCGSEALWDTDQLPPAGTPQIGEPVVWPCATCHGERRHHIVDLCLLPEKLRHAVTEATEIDGGTVDRVMTAADRLRGAGEDGCPAPDEVAAVADAAGVSPELVDRIAVAEAAWLCRHGYLRDISAER